MKGLDISAVQASLIDVSVYPSELVDGRLRHSGDTLLQKLVELVEARTGFAVCYGASKVLARHGLNVRVKADAEAARSFLEHVFRAAAMRFDLATLDPVHTAYDRVVTMDVDGFGSNQAFTPNSDHTQSREYVTTKCLHFDAATPFIANLYGPNENISGGLPIICDTRGYCLHRGLPANRLIENIPNNYNVAVREEFCKELLEDYSFAPKLDLGSDVVMVVLRNEVEGGVAHAATRPNLTDESKPGYRPIRHVEYQVPNRDELQRWYDHYGLRLEQATDYNQSATPPRYLRGESNAYPNLLEIGA